MAESIRLEFLTDGFREILECSEMEAFVKEEGDKMAARAGDGFECHTRIGNYGGGRAIGIVAPKTYEAMVAEAADKALTKAVM